MQFIRMPMLGAISDLPAPPGPPGIWMAGMHHFP
jgi:hypothetical protein